MSTRTGKCKVIPRWSIVFSIFVYSCFICIMISISLPLKSVKEINSNNFNKQFNKQTPHEQNIGKHFDKVKGDIWIKKGNDSSAHVKFDPKRLLTYIFYKTDVNKDSQLNVQEMALYINERVRLHIETAIRGNAAMFSQVDQSPRDGLVTWEEYHAHFLKEMGFADNYVNKHDEKRHSGLQRDIKELIMRDKAMWAEAARNDPFSLTLDEFLAFKHPESSAANMVAIVDDLFEKFDRDGDEYLTQDEFATLPDTADIQDIDSKMLKQGETERRKEFTYLVDKNKDGKADRMELLAYVDPRHPRHSLQEAATLINLADINLDGKLSLEEILGKMDLFLGSKMVDTARSFHDEF